MKFGLDFTRELYTRHLGISQSKNSDGHLRRRTQTACYISWTDMPKRAAVDASPGPEKVSRSVSGQARAKPAEDEMGEFEDAWEDEIERDEEDGACSDGAII